MKDILFRGKRTDNGEWVEGYYSPLLLPIFGNMGHFINQQGYNAVEVIPETVGQYTGMKDKNGTKIFEGDILGIDCESYKEVRAVVGYDEEMAAFVTKDNNELISECAGWENGKNIYIVVIGNIYDNPELIREEV